MKVSKRNFYFSVAEPLPKTFCRLAMGAIFTATVMQVRNFQLPLNCQRNSKTPPIEKCC